jgi:hypothetical protein
MTASWAVQSLGNESVSCEPNSGQSSVKPDCEFVPKAVIAVAHSNWF